MKFIRIMAPAAFGVLLGICGHRYTEWQFWALMLAAAVWARLSCLTDKG